MKSGLGLDFETLAVCVPNLYEALSSAALMVLLVHVFCLSKAWGLISSRQASRQVSSGSELGLLPAPDERRCWFQAEHWCWKTTGKKRNSFASGKKTATRVQSLCSSERGHGVCSPFLRERRTVQHSHQYKGCNYIRTQGLQWPKRKASENSGHLLDWWFKPNTPKWWNEVWKTQEQVETLNNMTNSIGKLGSWVKAELADWRPTG